MIKKMIQYSGLDQFKPIIDRFKRSNGDSREDDEIEVFNFNISCNESRYYYPQYPEIDNKLFKNDEYMDSQLSDLILLERWLGESIACGKYGFNFENREDIDYDSRVFVIPKSEYKDKFRRYLSYNLDASKEERVFNLNNDNLLYIEKILTLSFKLHYNYDNNNTTKDLKWITFCIDTIEDTSLIKDIYATNLFTFNRDEHLDMKLLSLVNIKKDPLYTGTNNSRKITMITLPLSIMDNPNDLLLRSLRYQLAIRDMILTPAIKSIIRNNIHYTRV